MDEITLLTQIRDGDPTDTRFCCRLYDSFEHMGPHGRHVCMVFEVLGDNLLSLIKQYDYRCAWVREAGAARLHFFAAVMLC